MPDVTKEELKEFIKTLTKALETWHPGSDVDNLNKAYPLFYKGKLVGFSYYKPWHDLKEMGIVIHRDYWGKGLGTEGITKICEIAKEDGYDSLIAKVLNKNKPMLHLMEKLDWECYESNDDYKMFKKTL